MRTTAAQLTVPGSAWRAGVQISQRSTARAVTGSASDNLGAAGITQTLSIDGKTVASAIGASLSFTWNTRKATVGSHVLMLSASDKAGNVTKTSTTVQVLR
jgi:thermitase